MKSDGKSAAGTLALDDRHYKVAYFTLKGADWSRVDASTCSKQ